MCVIEQIFNSFFFACRNDTAQLLGGICWLACRKWEKRNLDDYLGDCKSEKSAEDQMNINSYA